MAYVSRGFIPQTSLASNLGFTRPMYIPAGNATATSRNIHGTSEAKIACIFLLVMLQQPHSMTL